RIRHGRRLPVRGAKTLTIADCGMRIAKNHAIQSAIRNPQAAISKMQLFNRNVSVRGLTVFAFEVILISGSTALAASLHGSFSAANGPDALSTMLWKIALVTALCQLCFYYNDLYDLNVVHSNRELVVRLLQATGAAAIVLAAACVAVPSLILDP